MARPLNDSPFLYGFHDPGGEDIMAEQGIFGWILFTEELGSDPNNQSGRDYTPWSNRGFGVLARLNNGYEPDGTIPNSSRYAQFAQRCANFVAHSPGCHIWIIGNEMNYAVERPGVQYDWSQQPPVILSPGEVILPTLYASCYRQCRTAIKSLSGHENDQVIVGAVAPWNPQTTYPTNQTGDWVTYLADVLANLGSTANCDGISVHAYTHGADPKLIYSDGYMQSPFQNRQYNFRTYQDFLGAIPASMRSLPVYLTEADQNDTWLNSNNGWVQRAYGEINWWNQQAGTQKIRALILYRWPKGLDRWGIEDKPGVIADFRQAMAQRYSWVGLEPVQVYAVQFVSQNTPAQVTAGHTVPVSLVLRNSGNMTWAANGAEAVYLGYHWLDSAGRPVTLAEAAGIRTPLPKAVNPDEQIKVQAQLVAPDAAGAYTLQWDMVEGDKGWFAQVGASTLLSLKVNVQAEPQLITFSETGKTARGPFVTFYRQYGLDITGYPISDEYTASDSGLLTQDWQRVVMEEYPAGKIRLRLAGQQIHELQQAVARLQAQIDSLSVRSGRTVGLAGLPITDIIQQLPRNPGSLLDRPLDQIKYLVFSHTAVDAGVGANRIAAAHQRRWGAILYQYFIDGTGEIQQTNADDQVVDLTQPWITESINIAVAGNFNNAIPEPAQIESAARLCAWLMERYDIPAENILGASEFIPTQSPGLQWLQGQMWKNILLDRIAEIQQKDATGNAPAGDSIVDQESPETGPADATGEDERSHQPGLTLASGEAGTAGQAPAEGDAGDSQAAPASEAGLTRQIKTLANSKARLTWQVQALSAEKAALDRQLAAAIQERPVRGQGTGNLRTPQAGAGGTGAYTVPAPDIVDIVDQLPKHETLRYDTRTLDQITHLAIHHSAVRTDVTPEQIATYHVSQDWPGIGYHYYIEPDGTIYQTNRLETISYNVYDHNHYLVGICIAGTFNDAIPTAAQIDKLGHLVAWLMQKLNIKLENVLGHREFPENATECPGNQWLSDKAWKDRLISSVRAAQSGPAKCISHYVLFWQHGDDWAKEDWHGALNYITRFRPTAGFSAEDACAAEFVTIVGGPAGVSPETEQTLVAAGCKVERLAGVDFDDTKRMLDELATSGKRFRTFDVA